MTSHAGEVRRVTVEQSVEQNVIDQLMWWKAGDKVVDFLTQKFGIVFLQFSSMAEMKQKTENMQDLIRVELA
jgi:hypothetical protein